jgi:hypothetical protein
VGATASAGGTYTITPSAAQGAAVNNYNISYATADFAITARPITITATNQTAIYGNGLALGTTAFSANIGTNVGLVSGDGISAVTLQYNSTATVPANTNVNSYVGSIVASSATGTGNFNASNYKITYVAGDLNITARPITVTVDSGQSKVYGNGDPVLTYTPQANATNAGLYGSDTFTGSLVRATGENVGSYTISQGTLANSNYNINFVGSTFSITPATLIVTPTVGQSKNYGQSDPVFTYSVSGLVSNSIVHDTNASSVISGALARVAGDDIGNYPYSVSGLSAANYNINLVSAPSSFTVLPAPIGLTISGNYTGTNTISPANFTVTGLAFGQTITSISSAVVNNANVSANGANYITSVVGVTGTALMSNYYITPTYNANLNTVTTNVATITPAPLTIAAANDAKFVTQSDTVASANNCGSGPCTGGYMGLTFNGFVNGETVAALSGSPTIVRSNATVNGAGVYSGVLQPSGYSSSNYSINYVNGDYVIAPANALLVRVNPVLTTYGSAPTYTASAAYLANDGSTIVNLTPTITGSSVLVTDGVGGSASFNLSMLGASTSTSGNINVGGYNLGPINTSISGSNFNNLMVVGSATVQPYTLTPSQLGITSLSKVYDGNINIGGLVINTNPTLSNVLGSGSSKDQVTILGSGIFTQDANVGTGKNVAISLSLAGTDGGNYVLSSNTYSANIGTVTQLSSVNYIGPNGGNWSTQTNWAGGAIPNLSNVATAIIPAGYSVVYDASVIGTIGSVIQNNGVVTFNETTPFTLGNTLTGSGVFAQTGSAALTISGNNGQSSPGPFTGQFSIASGSTLLLANANALGSGSIISNNGNLGITSGTILANLTISGPVNLISNIATVGTQLYSGSVTIANGDQTLDGGMQISSQDADISFMGTINSDNANRSLVINAGLGKVLFNDTVGYLSPDHNHKSADINSLVVKAKNIDLFADVFTLNQQTYNGAVVVGDNGSNGLTRQFISEDPSVTFGGTVDDSSAITHTLDVKAVSYSADQSPSISFVGPIGSIVPLGALSVTTQTILPPPNPADPPVVQSAGNLTISGNITTVGGQNFSTGGVTLQPPAGGSITLNSKQGTVQFVGTPPSVVADLNSQVSVLNNSAPYVPPTVPTVQVVSNNAIVPVLAPPEAAFMIETETEGRVYVNDPGRVMPCQSVTKDECSKS